MNSIRTKKVKIVKVLIIVFSALLLFSLVYLYNVHQQPILERKIVTIASYVHRAMYDYVAELKPNIIYNKTILRPGEGILYATLTNKINISFIYMFSSNPPPEAINVVMRGLTAKIESPDKWTKVLQKEELIELLNFRGSVNFTLEVDCLLLKQIVNAIDKELGVYSSSYNLFIAPEVLVNARIAGRSVSEVYTPQLTVTFKISADRGGYISLEGLEQTQSREIKDVIEVFHPEVESQRVLSYIATILATVGLATSMLIHYRVKWHEKKKLVDVKLSRMIREHRDVIVEALTSLPEVHATIEVRSLEDLVKIAEVLAKPILKAMEDEKQVFYVVDGNIKYQYKV
ncbi:MAG: DUF5305 family protein [Candidatus Nezhaarchaeales archaeon]